MPKKCNIYIIIIHTHTGKTTHPQFSGHDGKKNATFSFCWYCLFTRQNGQSERMLQSYWQQNHIFSTNQSRNDQKTWSGPFDKNRQRDCGYIYTIIIDIYVYQIISNILYTSIAWVFLFKPTFHLYIMSYHRRRPTSAQGLTMSGCRASHLKPSAHRGRIIKISSGFPSKQGTIEKKT